MCNTPDERYEQGDPRIISRDQQELIERLTDALRAHRAAAINFVARVEDGTARSIVSYAEFKAALKRSEGLL